jgi:hypothetical protein
MDCMRDSLLDVPPMLVEPVGENPEVVKKDAMQPL